MKSNEVGRVEWKIKDNGIVCEELLNCTFPEYILFSIMNGIHSGIPLCCIGAFIKWEVCIYYNKKASLRKKLELRRIKTKRNNTYCFCGYLHCNRHHILCSTPENAALRKIWENQS